MKPFVGAVSLYRVFLTGGPAHEFLPLEVNPNTWGLKSPCFEGE